MYFFIARVVGLLAFSTLFIALGTFRVWWDE
jgi:hypothetical protein